MYTTGNEITHLRDLEERGMWPNLRTHWALRNERSWADTGGHRGMAVDRAAVNRELMRIFAQGRTKYHKDVL